METQEAVALGAREDTIATLFWARVQAGGDGVALREKDLGIWQSISWCQLGETARALGLGLLARGLVPGDRVCVLSENNPQWLYADFGTLGAGGVTSGIYPTDAPNQVAYIVADMDQAVPRYEALFGPFTVSEQTLPDCTVRGATTDLEMKMAVSSSSPVEIELIQPVKGDSPWPEHRSEA